MSRAINQGSTANVLVYMVDETDLKTPETGLTVSIELLKDGDTTFAAASDGTVTEAEFGWYSVALDATDTNTPGDLVVRGTATGAWPGERVVSIASNGTNNKISYGGTIINGETALAYFYMASSVDHVSPVTGAALTFQQSEAGSALSTITPVYAELGGGIYYAQVSATYNPVIIIASATGADDYSVTFDMQLGFAEKTYALALEAAQLAQVGFLGMGGISDGGATVTFDGSQATFPDYVYFYHESVSATDGVLSTYIGNFNGGSWTPELSGDISYAGIISMAFEGTGTIPVGNFTLTYTDPDGASYEIVLPVREEITVDNYTYFHYWAADGVRAMNGGGRLAQLSLAATAGAGAIEWTYTLTSSVDSSPIADADVWVTTDSAGSNVVASGRTDAYGVVTFYLDAGTVYIWRQKSGWDFTNPDTEVVS